MANYTEHTDDYRVEQCEYCERYIFGPCGCTRFNPLPPIRISAKPRDTTPEWTKEYHRKWREFHCEIDPNPIWLEAFVSSLPNFCKCQPEFRSIIERIPPRYNDWLAWTVEIHNEVNLNLTRPVVSIEEALRMWRPKPTKQEPITCCRIVTAFGPNRIDRQQYCLDTWLRSGFSVSAIQTSEEMPAMKAAFGGVDWIEENRVTTDYEYSTQRISRFLVEAHDEPILLLNSDCAMVGDANRFRDHLQVKENRFYLRWNHEPNGIANEFEFGIDGLLFWPGQLGYMPELWSMPYGIGQPMWDYAVPYILRSLGVSFAIDHYPWLFHENHAQNWSQAAWEFGADWLVKQYPKSNRRYFQKEFRETLDAGMKYDHASGIWIDHIQS